MHWAPGRELWKPETMKVPGQCAPRAVAMWMKQPGPVPSESCSIASPPRLVRSRLERANHVSIEPVGKA